MSCSVLPSFAPVRCCLLRHLLPTLMPQRHMSWWGELNGSVNARATGVLLSRRQVERASELCAAAGAWLVLDNTYEHFVYDGREHFCMAGPHILNIFSFSKVPAAPVCASP